MDNLLHILKFLFQLLRFIVCRCTTTRPPWRSVHDYFVSFAGRKTWSFTTFVQFSTYCLMVPLGPFLLACSGVSSDPFKRCVLIRSTLCFLLTPLHNVTCSKAPYPKGLMTSYPFLLIARTCCLKSEQILDETVGCRRCTSFYLRSCRRRISGSNQVAKSLLNS